MRDAAGRGVMLLMLHGLGPSRQGKRHFTSRIHRSASQRADLWYTARQRSTRQRTLLPPAINGYKSASDAVDGSSTGT